MKARFFIRDVITLVLSSSLALDGVAESINDFMLAPVSAPTSISFNQAIKLGLEKSADLKKAEQRIVIAKSDELLTTSKLLPKLSLNLGHSATNRADAESLDENANAGLKTTIPLLDAKSLIELRSKRESVVTSKDSFDADQDTVINIVGSLYIDALIAEAAMKNALDEEEQYKTSLVSFERRKGGGAARSLDVLNARYLANKAHSEYLLRSQEYQKSLGELGKKIGMREVFLLSPVFIDSPYLSKDKAELQTIANQAADMNKARSDIAAVDFSLLSEKFDFLPKVNAMVDGGWMIPYQKGELASKNQLSVKLMVNLELPLFSGGSSLAAMRNKHANKVINEITLRAKVSEKILSINGLLEQIRELALINASAQLALGAAMEARASAERLFDKKEITGFEFEKTNTNLFSARNQVTTTALRLEQAKLRLLYVIGKIKEIV